MESRPFWVCVLAGFSFVAGPAEDTVGPPRPAAASLFWGSGSHLLWPPQVLCAFQRQPEEADGSSW